MDKVGMKVRFTYGIEEERVLDSIEGFRDIYSNCRGTERRLRGVEARGDACSSGKESSNRRVVRTEAVLGGGWRERRREMGENATFEDFRGGTEEGDGAVGGRDGSRFTGFRDWQNDGLFPDGRHFRLTNRQVKEMSEKRYSPTPKVFKMDHCNRIRTSRS